LKALAERRERAGQGVADAIKRAGSAVLGVGAAAVDFVRSEKLPKDLRDDFTAMNMANVGYLMLYTTALSLDDREVAELAQRHLKDHTQCTATLQNLIPDAVVRFLQEDGLPARRDVLSEISRSLESFRAGAGGMPIADDTVSPTALHADGFDAIYDVYGPGLHPPATGAIHVRKNETKSLSFF
jgi:hypothetical protein